MQPKPLKKYLGDRLRSIRESQGLRQEEVVTRARQMGLRWTPSTVTAIENGHRDLSVGEFMLLPTIFGGRLAEIFCDEGTVIELAAGITLPCLDARLLLTGQWTPAPTKPQWPVEIDPDRLVLEAERKAAARLGVTPEQLVDAAVALWGHSLSAERERVTWERNITTRADPMGTPMRSFQAIRGHVTRELISKLRDYLNAAGEDKS